ncbi:MAG: hypothetical protein AB7C90_01760 [Bacteroidales bacterium]
MIKPTRQQIICTIPDKQPEPWFDIKYKIIVGDNEYLREYSCQALTAAQSRQKLEALIRFDEIDQFIILSNKRRK